MIKKEKRKKKKKRTKKTNYIQTIIKTQGIIEH